VTVRCDVVAVGTELLLGQIIDSNSAWMGEALAAVGIDSLVQVKVGDNVSRVAAAISDRLAEADAVVVCGGLGPTHDDVTREAIAAVMGVGLVHDDEIADVIRSMFAARGRTMPSNNLRQALVPLGARVIAQTRGTAPGLICPVGDKVVYAVPGVPHEMTDMMERAVIPDLLGRGGPRRTIVSRVLRTWGESESGLNERLAEIISELDGIGNPTLAFLASGWEGIKVRLTASGPDAEAAGEVLAAWERRVRERVGDVVFGVDDQTMESVVLGDLHRRSWTLALAESVTGGLVAARLTTQPGSSAVLRGAVVSYASEVKWSLLGVDEGPVVNESAAEQMAVGVRSLLGADVGLSLTGVAGPDEQDGMPVGTLCVGICLADGATRVATLRLPGSRDQMRQLSVISALDLLRRTLASDAPL
jgi:nicotinamide-nucleotide amidase